MEKFRNKYKVESNRLQKWDYGWNAAYYITICTQNREWFFGKISNCINELSNIGKIAEKYWAEIPLQPTTEPTVEPIAVGPTIGRTIVTVGFAGNKNPMLNENISRIIRWYKGRVSFECGNFHFGFGWQPRFYDHIIRNNEEFLRIRSYIIDNPVKWTEDEFYI